MKAVVAAFNQEKALVGAFSVITNLWMELFEAQVNSGGIGTVCALLRHYWVPAAYCFNIGFMNTNAAFMLLMIISQSVNIAIYKPRAELRPKVFVVTK